MSEFYEILEEDYYRTKMDIYFLWQYKLLLLNELRTVETKLESYLVGNISIDCKVNEYFQSIIRAKLIFINRQIEALEKCLE